MRYINLIFFLLLPIFFFIESNSNENKEIIKNNSGKIFFIRHAIAPGTGDPENFELNDCKTQRNLSLEGISQSINIGKYFKKNDIKIYKVLSSEWCRCKDTAEFAFSKFEIFSSLNSFYDKKFRHNKNKQIKNLKFFFKNLDDHNNLVLVTHYVVIFEVLGISANSGEIIVTNKNLDIIERINIK